MEAFWCITFSFLLVRWWWKNNFPKQERIALPPPIDIEKLKKMDADEKTIKAAKEAEKQRQRDIADLKKQGYTDEIIAVILPTINNGQ